MLALNAYDFIEECREEAGDEFVDKMLDNGFEPVLVPGRGWRWIQVKPVNRLAR